MKELEKVGTIEFQGQELTVFNDLYGPLFLDPECKTQIKTRWGLQRTSSSSKYEQVFSGKLKVGSSHKLCFSMCNCHG